MLRNAAGLLGRLGGGWRQGFLRHARAGADDDEGVGVQVLGHGGPDLFDAESLDLLEEAFQVVQRQAVETDGAELADDVGVARGGQREAAGQFALGVVQFLLGRAVGQVVADDVLDQLQRPSLSSARVWKLIMNGPRACMAVKPE